MRTFIVTLFLLGLTQSVKSQMTKASDMSGLYFVDICSQAILMICEDSNWFYKNTYFYSISMQKISNNCDSIIVDVEGKYYYEESFLYLLHRNGSLFLKLEIVDSLNLQIVYTSKILTQGLYFNRVAYFYPGYNCYSFSYGENLEFIKWSIERNDKIYRFHSLGYIFRSKYTVEKLQPGYWKRNEIQK